VLRWRLPMRDVEPARGGQWRGSVGATHALAVRPKFGLVGDRDRAPPAVTDADAENAAAPTTLSISPVAGEDADRPVGVRRRGPGRCESAPMYALVSLLITCTLASAVTATLDPADSPRQPT
jgi:hypothetical protein